MEEIEYLEEYEDLVLPAINSAAEAAANTQNSKLVNVDNDGSSSSLDQDIFNCLFDDNSDDDIEEIQTNLKGQEILNIRGVKTQSAYIDSKNFENSTDSKTKSITPKNIDKKLGINSIVSLKNKTIAIVRPTEQQKHLHLKVDTNIDGTQSPSAKAAKESSNFEKPNLSKFNTRRSIVGSNINSIHASTSSSTKSCKSNQSKISKNRPATIIKPEKVITKDPAEDPLNLDDLSSAESANFSVSDISGETCNSISDFDDDDYDFPSKIEALDGDDDDSTSSHIIDISNDSSESRFQFDYLRGSTPSPVVSEDRDEQHSPTKLMANHDIIKCLLTKGERPKLLQLISKQEKSHYVNVSNEPNLLDRPSVTEISKEVIAKTFISKEPTIEDKTNIKSNNPPSHMSTLNENLKKESTRRISDKILNESVQNSSLYVSKPHKDEILQNQEVGAEMEIGNAEPVANIPDEQTKSGDGQDPKILLDTKLPKTNINESDNKQQQFIMSVVVEKGSEGNDKTNNNVLDKKQLDSSLSTIYPNAVDKKQKSLNSADVEEKVSIYKSKDSISTRPRKKRLKNLFSTEENKEDDQIAEKIGDITSSIQSEKSNLTKKNDDNSSQNQIFEKKIDKKQYTSLSSNIVMTSKGSFKSTSKGLNKSARNISRDSIKDGLCDGLREVPKAVIMNPFVQRGTKNPSGNKTKLSNEVESTRADLKKQDKDKHFCKIDETELVPPFQLDGKTKDEVDSSQKSNLTLDTSIISTGSKIKNQSKSLENDEIRKKQITRSENIVSTEKLTSKMSIGSEENRTLKKTKAFETVGHSEKLPSTSETLDKSQESITSNTADESDKKHNERVPGKFEDKDVKENAYKSQTINSPSNTVPSSQSKSNIGQEKLDRDKMRLKDKEEENILKSENVSNSESQPELVIAKPVINASPNATLHNKFEEENEEKRTASTKKPDLEARNVSNTESHPKLVETKSDINASSIATLHDTSVSVENNKSKEENEHKRTASKKKPNIAKSYQESQVSTNNEECNADYATLRSTAVISKLNDYESSDLSEELSKKNEDLTEISDTNKQVSNAKGTRPKTKSLKVINDPENLKKNDICESTLLTSKTSTEKYFKTDIRNEECEKVERNNIDFVNETSKKTVNTEKSQKNDNQSPSGKNQECDDISNTLSIMQNVKRDSVSTKELQTIEDSLKVESAFVETMSKTIEITKDESATSTTAADTLQESKDNLKCISSKVKDQNLRKTRSIKPDQSCLESGRESSYSLVQSGDLKDIDIHNRNKRNTKSDEEIQQNKNHTESQSNIYLEKNDKYVTNDEITEFHNVSSQTSCSSTKIYIRKTRSSANTDCNTSRESECMDESRFNHSYDIMNDNIIKTPQSIQRKNRDTQSNCEKLFTNIELKQETNLNFKKYEVVDKDNQTEEAMSNIKIISETMPQRKGRTTRKSLDPKTGDNKKKSHNYIGEKPSIKICGNDGKSKIEVAIINSCLSVAAADKVEIRVDKTSEMGQQIKSISKVNQQEMTADHKSDTSHKKESINVNNTNKNQSISITKDIDKMNTKSQKSSNHCKLEQSLEISKNFRTSTPKHDVPLDSVLRSEPIGYLQKSLNEVNQTQSDPSDRTHNLRRRGGESPYNGDRDGNSDKLMLRFR